MSSHVDICQFTFGLLTPSLPFASTILSQLIYTFGGSAFAGGNGSMMIEVVVRPFLSPWLPLYVGF